MNPQRGSRRFLKQEKKAYVVGTSRIPTESTKTERGPSMRRYEGKPQRGKYQQIEPEESKEAKKPKRSTAKRVEVPDRQVLLHFLMLEYEQGNALSKLYVSLLARTVIDQAPDLIDTSLDNDAVRMLDTLWHCGVRGYKPNMHTEAVKQWHPLTSGKI